MIRDAGRSFAHLTDTELGAVGEADDFFEQCVDFCQGVDVLSHDAQYLAAEMVECTGRGHSSVERVCDLAEAACASRLVLFHHDPDRDDDALDGIGSTAADRLAASAIGCSVANEGMTIEL